MGILGYLALAGALLCQQRKGRSDDANSASTDRLPSYSEASKWPGGLLMFFRRLNSMTSNWRSKEKVTGQTPPPTYSEATGVNLFFRQLSRQFSRSKSDPSSEGQDVEDSPQS